MSETNSGILSSGELPVRWKKREPEKAGSRLVIVSTVSHQRNMPDVAEQPKVVETRVVRKLSSTEQVWEREMMVSSLTWTGIEKGWIVSDGCSKMCVKNLGKSVVELGILSPLSMVTFALVHPGEVESFTPFRLDDLRVRFIEGRGKVVVTLFPK